MSNRNKPKTRTQKQFETQDRLRKKHASNQGPKKICLTMIVKNEAKNMPRLLDSVKPIIDMICISDTGSTDPTEEIIIKWGKENNIPTTVCHEPFRDFAFNRTECVRIAKVTYPDADYFLLSDADFVWEIDVDGKFDKTLLVDHQYTIEQYNKTLTYDNVRLLSAKVNFSCIGFTHEFWESNKTQTEFIGQVRAAKIKTLRIDDREDGGCKEDKFVRDERLLRRGLNEEKKNKGLVTRYKFYLAQTLKDMGRFEESIDWYNKRIDDKGWVEEVYYSKFQIGYCCEQLGWKKKEAVAILGKSERTQFEIDHLANGILII